MTDVYKRQPGDVLVALDLDVPDEEPRGREQRETDREPCHERHAMAQPPSHSRSAAELERLYRALAAQSECARGLQVARAQGEPELSLIHI